MAINNAQETHLSLQSHSNGQRSTAESEVPRTDNILHPNWVTWRVPMPCYTRTKAVSKYLNESKGFVPAVIEGEFSHSSSHSGLQKEMYQLWAGNDLVLVKNSPYIAVGGKLALSEHLVTGRWWRCPARQVAAGSEQRLGCRSCEIPLPEPEKSRFKNKQSSWFSLLMTQWFTQDNTFQLWRALLLGVAFFGIHCFEWKWEKHPKPVLYPQYPLDLTSLTYFPLFLLILLNCRSIQSLMAPCQRQ